MCATMRTATQLVLHGRSRHSRMRGSVMLAVDSTKRNPTFTDASLPRGFSNLPEYKVWLGIKCRCECPSATGYNRYGLRGITVCDEWTNSFATFYSDVGPRPTPKHTLERSDNDKGYSKENCCWATRKQQMRNCSRNHLITYHGETMCLQEWADRLGLNKTTLRKRLSRGWSVERAFGESPRKQPREILLTFDGQTMNVAEWASVLGIPAPTLYTRLSAGLSIELVLSAQSTRRS